MNFIKHSLAACCLVVCTAMGAHAMDEAAVGMAEIGEAMDATQESQMMTSDGRAMLCSILDLAGYGSCLLRVAISFQRCMDNAAQTDDPALARMICEFNRSQGLGICKLNYTVCQLREVLAPKKTR